MKPSSPPVLLAIIAGTIFEGVDGLIFKQKNAPHPPKIYDGHPLHVGHPSNHETVATFREDVKLKNMKNSARRLHIGLEDLRIGDEDDGHWAINNHVPRQKCRPHLSGTTIKLKDHLIQMNKGKMGMSNANNPKVSKIKGRARNTRRKLGNKNHNLSL